MFEYSQSFHCNSVTVFNERQEILKASLVAEGLKRIADVSEVLSDISDNRMLICGS